VRAAFTHSHRVQDWLILEAPSVSYGKATSHLPVIDLLKGCFKISDRDDRREMRAKVLGRVLGLDRALEPLLRSSICAACSARRARAGAKWSPSWARQAWASRVSLTSSPANATIWGSSNPSAIAQLG
jgi:hypothetical protein